MQNCHWRNPQADRDLLEPIFSPSFGSPNKFTTGHPATGPQLQRDGSTGKDGGTWEGFVHAPWKKQSQKKEPCLSEQSTCTSTTSNNPRKEFAPASDMKTDPGSHWSVWTPMAVASRLQACLLVSVAATVQRQIYWDILRRCYFLIRAPYLLIILESKHAQKIWHS